MGTSARPYVPYRSGYTPRFLFSFFYIITHLQFNI
jgi:hypothetical protein